MDNIVSRISTKRINLLASYLEDLHKGVITYETYQKNILDITNKKLPIKPIFKYLKIGDFQNKLDIKDRFTATPEELHKIINYLNNLTILRFQGLYKNIINLATLCDLLSYDLVYFELHINPLAIKIYSPSNLDNLNYLGYLNINFEQYIITSGSKIIYHSIKPEDSIKEINKKIYNIIKVYIN